jgi:asparagine synthase (glutamine-hydrolysing)
MCGLAGFAGSGDRGDLRAMVAALIHRGPDGEGIYVDPDARVYLGHRRLAIIDIEGGAQPMWSANGHVGVVFNGEIYNHAELRGELEKLGHVFRTSHSDTEVLVHGYVEWGSALPERLNGMFAFAVYDRPRKRLFLARDRFGEKPLFYSLTPQVFAFASELTALVRHPGVDDSLSLRSLQKFFAYGYVPAPNALFNGCHKLPGGHYLVHDLESGTISVNAYWRFRVAPDRALDDVPELELVEELRALLDQAVRRRLISDVPLGVFLSGGLDSSAVALAAARALPAGTLKTFTIGFTEASFDESPFARRVAAVIGSDHGERVLEAEGAADLVPRVLSELDEPLGDASLLPTYLLSRFTRETVTVALSGDGGDELFAGYDPFDALGIARRYARLVPAGVHRSFRRLADLLPVSDRNMSLEFKLKRGLMGMSYAENARIPIWMAPVEPDLMGELFNEPLRLEDLYEEAIAVWNSAESTHPVDRGLDFFTNIYLQDDILAKVDRASMMVSLESRAVFLDNDLVEFCRRLPSHYKYRNGTRKYLLKKALEGQLPRDLVHRPKKGFGIPLARWLRSMPEVMPRREIAGVKRGWMSRCFDEHRTAKSDHRLSMWCWLSLQQILARRESRPVSGLVA